MTTSKIDPQLSDNALTILKVRYLIGDETPKGMFERVASAVASAEETGDEKQFWENRQKLLCGMF